MKNNGTELKPFRCWKCGRLLAKEHILVGVVEIKCKSCKETNLAIGEYEIIDDDYENGTKKILDNKE